MEELITEANYAHNSLSGIERNEGYLTIFNRSGKELGEALIYTDSENDNRLYICLNNEIVYLDDMNDFKLL